MLEICCVLCNKNLVVQRIIDGESVNMLSPDFSKTSYILNTGSNIDVTICTSCKSKNDLNDDKIKDKINKAIMEGWRKESEELLNDKLWTREKGNSYLKAMNKLSVVLNCDHLSNNVIGKFKDNLKKS